MTDRPCSRLKPNNVVTIQPMPLDLIKNYLGEEALKKAIQLLPPSKGDKGDQGIQGIPGLKGDQGDQGIQGIPGLKGDKGDQGIQGIPGLKGDKGDHGIQGIPGLKGDKGDQGIQGIPGLKGDKGDQGTQGIQGIPGLKGDKGDQGIQGESVDIEEVRLLIAEEVKSNNLIKDIEVTEKAGSTYLQIIRFDDSVTSIKIKTVSSGGSGFKKRFFDYIEVRTINDFGKQDESGNIQLNPNTTYFVIGTVDLNGAYLTGALNTCILGPSSENAFITSTGLAAETALFTTSFTTPIRHVTFINVTKAIHIDGNLSGSNPALDWTGVNFQNVPNVGFIANSSNWIYSKGAFINSQGLVFSGIIGTIGIDNSIFTGNGTAGSIISIDENCTILRRSRFIYSSFVVTGDTVGIDVSVSAVIPVEGYVLSNINFSGGGTYLDGVQYLDNKSRFYECRGIQNTASIGNYYMFNNAVPTTFLGVSTPVKILGTTLPNTVNQKFSHSNNRLTYTGVLTRSFHITATATILGTNNRLIGLYIAKNGTPINSSEMYATTDGVGKAESIAIQTIIDMNDGDYIEVFIENGTDLTDFTVNYLNLVAKASI